MESPQIQMIINRNYMIIPYVEYDKTYIGKLIKTSSIGPKEYEYKFNNLTKLERTQNGPFIPTRINGTMIFNTRDYFELLEDGRKSKRRKSKSRKRKSRKRKSV